MPMLLQYKAWKPEAESADAVDKANEILAAYAAQGYDLTLRQLYYQFVARDLFPDTRKWKWTGRKYVRDADGTKNAEPNYKWLGDVVGKARDAGMIDWERIQDRGRGLYGNTHHASGEAFLDTVADDFYLDLWEGQDRRVQVWVEKDALSDVVGRAAAQWDVDYFPCKGYMSASAIWRMARMMTQRGGRWLVLHLGDHDPSGVDMSRDIEDRLLTYSAPIKSRKEKRPEIVVRRIALTMQQVEHYDPPPNPTKMTDSRAGGYCDEYGEECWELDALEPQVIADLISSHIEGELSDADLFQERRDWQASIRDELRNVRLGD